jgi:hypothetical protein
LVWPGERKLGQPSRYGEPSEQELDEKEASELMDEYTVEIDELRGDAVVLVVPALCLLAFGRTLDEAMRQVRASIGFRLRESLERPEAAITPNRPGRYLEAHPTERAACKDSCIQPRTPEQSAQEVRQPRSGRAGRIRAAYP